MKTFGADKDAAWRCGACHDSIGCYAAAAWLSGRVFPSAVPFQRKSQGSSVVVLVVFALRRVVVLVALIGGSLLRLWPCLAAGVSLWRHSDEWLYGYRKH